LIIKPVEAIQLAQSAGFGFLRKKELLSKRWLPTQVGLSFKIFLSKWQHYITLSLVTCLFLWMGLMTSSLSQTFKGDIDSLLGLPKIDLVLVGQNESAQKQVLAKISANYQLLLSGQMVDTKISINNQIISSHDYSQIPKGISVVTGRFPKQDDELLMSTTLLNSLKYKLGDKINVDTTGGSKQMTIVGTYQTINNLGIEVYRLTNQGTSTFVTLKDHALKDQVIKKFKVKAQSEGIQIIDGSASNDNLVKVLQSAVSFLSLVVQILTILILALFLILLTYLSLQEESALIALEKMIGFKVNDISKQYLLRSLMAVVVGLIGGFILNWLLSQPLINKLAGLGGLTKLPTATLSITALGFASILILETLVIVQILAKSTRKIKIGDYL
jgi:putative ABC transport system permease protein